MNSNCRCGFWNERKSVECKYIDKDEYDKKPQNTIGANL